VEDVGTVEALRLPASRDDLGQLTSIDRYHEPVTVLAALGT
jgi:hypothetical protein